MRPNTFSNSAGARSRILRNREDIIRKLKAERAREHARVLRLAVPILRLHNEKIVADVVEKLARELE